MTAVIWPSDGDDNYNLTTLGLIGPTTIGLLVQNSGLTVSLQVRGDPSYPWASAMPPGLTNLSNVLTYVHIARGFQYRLYASAGIPAEDIAISFTTV